MREISVYKCADTKLEKPFRILVCGASGCGKTEIVKTIVDSNHFATPFDRMIYCYPSYLEEAPVEFDQIIEYRPGTLDMDYLSSLPQNSLIILDDMMDECAKSDDIMILFMNMARKKNISIFLITQNLYYPGNSQNFKKKFYINFYIVYYIIYIE